MSLLRRPIRILLPILVLLAAAPAAGAQQLSIGGLTWGMAPEQAKARLEGQGYRFRGIDQDGDYVFWAPRQGDLVVSVAPEKGVIGMQVTWMPPREQIPARFRALADSLRRALGRPSSAEEDGVTWERGGTTLYAFGHAVGPIQAVGITVEGPDSEAELERRSNLELAARDRAEQDTVAPDSAVVGDWARIFSDARVIAWVDSAGTRAVSPGVVHTRLSEKWMFTRRLENGIKYDGKISEVELDCRTMRQRTLSYLATYAEAPPYRVIVPPAERAWTTPGELSAEGRGLRRACQKVGAAR